VINIDPDGRQWVWTRVSNGFRWVESALQQSDLTDPNDRFVGINYLYTGDNGVRSFLDDKGNAYASTMMLNQSLYKDFSFNPNNYEPMGSKDINGEPVGYIVPIPVIKPEHLDSKLLWQTGTLADVGIGGLMSYGKEAGILAPISLTAGMYPALINILNGVGNNDDLIALGLGTVTAITMVSPAGPFVDAVLTGAAIVNDFRTMPGGEEPTEMPIGGYYNGEENAYPDAGNNDPDPDFGGD
jgi:hypothetical protein